MDDCQQRVRSCCLDDPIYQLKELEQIGGIKEYYEVFDSFRVQIDLPEEFFISWFIAGLRSDIRKALQGCRFTSVVQAYAMGKIYELVHPRELVGSESISLASSLQLPSRNSAHPRQSVTVQERSSSAASLLSPFPVTRDSTRSSSLAILESASTPVLQLSSSIRNPPLDSSEEKQSTTSPAIGKDFESTEPYFQRATSSGKSSTCRIVESLEFKGLRGNLISVETRNREDELKIVETLPEIANRDEYQLETKEFGNSVSGAHKLFDEMPRRSLEPVLEGEPTIGCVVDDSSFREFLVHLSMVDMFTFDPGGRITVAVKPISLDLSGIESHVLVHCSTKPSTVDAPNLFEELPDLKAIRCLVDVLGTKVGGRNNLEVLSIPKSFDHVGGLVKLVFYPGGQITKEVEILELNWSGNKRVDHVNMIAGHQLMFLKIVMSRNEKSARVEIDGARLRDELFVFTIDPSGGEHKAFTEVADLLLQFESFTPIFFFYPGGSFLLFKCHIIQRKIRSWNLQCMVIQEEFACWVKERELGADCREFTLLQWDPEGFILVKFVVDMGS